MKGLTSIMRTAGLALAGTMLATSAFAADISGAGATFPYPIYAKWADAYKKETGIGLNYQSIGSGGGIKQIKAKTVTFGASDKPLKPEALEEAGLMQFPMVMGGVVPVVNVKGIKMTSPVKNSFFMVCYPIVLVSGGIYSDPLSPVTATKSGSTTPQEMMYLKASSTGMSR